MIRFDDIPNIYLFTGPTDLRKGIDGYAAIIENEIGRAVFEDSLFLFCNRTRNKIKVFVIDRKNFLFSDTIHGAKITMVYLSLIQSAILNGLDPNLYLQ